MLESLRRMRQARHVGAECVCALRKHDITTTPASLLKLRHPMHNLVTNQPTVRSMAIDQQCSLGARFAGTSKRYLQAMTVEYNTMKKCVRVGKQRAHFFFPFFPEAAFLGIGLSGDFALNIASLEAKAALLSADASSLPIGAGTIPCSGTSPCCVTSCPMLMDLAFRSSRGAFVGCPVAEEGSGVVSSAEPAKQYNIRVPASQPMQARRVLQQQAQQTAAPMSECAET